MRNQNNHVFTRLWTSQLSRLLYLCHLSPRLLLSTRSQSKIQILLLSNLSTRLKCAEIGTFMGSANLTVSVTTPMVKRSWEKNVTYQLATRLSSATTSISLATVLMVSDVSLFTTKMRVRSLTLSPLLPIPRDSSRVFLNSKIFWNSTSKRSKQLNLNCKESLRRRAGSLRSSKRLLRREAVREKERTRLCTLDPFMRLRKRMWKTQKLS